MSETQGSTVVTEVAPAPEQYIVHVEFDDGFPPIDIDVNALTWGDIELISKAEVDPNRDVPLDVLVDMMKRLCPDGAWRKLSFRRDTKRFFQAVGQANREANNPNS